MKISIIVPVYNVEKYLSRCLDSILNQDMPSNDYEIILVNDGSTDNSGVIAHDYSLKHHNITYIEQENKGLSGARNTGIKNAQGKYIWFVDSDDFIKDNILKQLILLAEENTTEILFFLLEEIHDNLKQITCKQNVILDKIISGRDAIISGYNPCSVCSAIFLSKFIKQNELFFYEGITHEDVEFSYKALLCAKKVLFTKLIAYIYYIRSNSLTTSTDSEHIIKNYVDNIYIAKSFEKLIDHIKDDKLLKRTIQNRIRDIIFGNIYNLWIQRKKLRHDNIINKILSEYRNYGYYPLIAPFKSWKHYLIANLFLNKLNNTKS